MTDLGKTTNKIDRLLGLSLILHKHKTRTVLKSFQMHVKTEAYVLYHRKIYFKKGMKCVFFYRVIKMEHRHETA